MFAKTAFAAVFVTAAVAAPAARASLPFQMPDSVPEPVAYSEEKAAAGEQWTVKYLKRECNKADTVCEWRYIIETSKNSYHIVYDVTGSPASQTDVTTPITAEVFQITQGWDSQGFTVIVPVYPGDGRRIYAGFSDAEYANGVTAPTKTFPVERS